MTLTRKNIPALAGFALIGLIIGSLCWEIVERVLQTLGSSLSLTLVNPIVLDVHVISLGFRPNIGSLFGLVGGIVLFFAV